MVDRSLQRFIDEKTREFEVNAAAYECGYLAMAKKVLAKLTEGNQMEKPTSDLFHGYERPVIVSHTSDGNAVALSVAGTIVYLHDGEATKIAESLITHDKAARAAKEQL